MDDDLYPNNDNETFNIQNVIDLPVERQEEEVRSETAARNTETLLPEIKRRYHQRIKEMNDIDKLGLEGKTDEEMAAMLRARTITIKFLKSDLAWIEGKMGELMTK